MCTLFYHYFIIILSSSLPHRLMSLGCERSLFAEKSFPPFTLSLSKTFVLQTSGKVWVDCQHVDDKMYRGDKLLSYIINASCVENSGITHMGDHNGASMMRNNEYCWYDIADSIHWHCHILFLLYHGSIIVVVLNFCLFINRFCFSQSRFESCKLNF